MMDYFDELSDGNGIQEDNDSDDELLYNSGDESGNILL